MCVTEKMNYSKFLIIKTKQSKITFICLFSFIFTESIPHSSLAYFCTDCIFGFFSSFTYSMRIHKWKKQIKKSRYCNVDEHDEVCEVLAITIQTCAHTPVSQPNQRNKPTNESNVTEKRKGSKFMQQQPVSNALHPSLFSSYCIVSSRAMSQDGCYFSFTVFYPRNHTNKCNMYLRCMYGPLRKAEFGEHIHEETCALHERAEGTIFRHMRCCDKY